MGSFSIWHWLIVLAVVILVFGTKKLASAGKDVGSGIRNFKDAMREGQAEGEQHVAGIRKDLGMGQPPVAAPPPPPAGTAGTSVPVITPVNADGTPRA